MVPNSALAHSGRLEIFEDGAFFTAWAMATSAAHTLFGEQGGIELLPHHRLDGIAPPGGDRPCPGRLVSRSSNVSSRGASTGSLAMSRARACRLPADVKFRAHWACKRTSEPESTAS